MVSLSQDEDHLELHNEYIYESPNQFIYMALKHGAWP